MLLLGLVWLLQLIQPVLNKLVEFTALLLVLLV
jgi:hypothetical protein